MVPKIEETILINALPEKVWDYLTIPSLMKQWMGEEEIGITIDTSWQIGAPIVIKGFHHAAFENKGTVLEFKPGELLSYSHLSSLSRLPENPESFTVFTFHLRNAGEKTLLTILVENFPTETIYRHLALYWKTTILILKAMAEDQLP